MAQRWYWPNHNAAIAAAFRLFGIGLLQGSPGYGYISTARYLCFYRLASPIDGSRLAWVATALLIASRGVSLLEYGRQGAGEVPGFFFLVAGLGLWFAGWEKAPGGGWGWLGCCSGLAMVTKNPISCLVLAPTLGLAWLRITILPRRPPTRFHRSGPGCWCLLRSLAGLYDALLGSGDGWREPGYAA